MAHHGHKFDPSMRDRLLEPKRARYLPAKEILSKFPLKAGGAAVDIGSGPGYWTIPMAELLGPLGRVYAVDLAEEMLEALRTRLEKYPKLDIQVYSGRQNMTRAEPTKLLCPSLSGGNNYFPSSYSPNTKLIYIWSRD